MGEAYRKRGNVNFCFFNAAVIKYTENFCSQRLCVPVALLGFGRLYFTDG